MKMLIEGQWVDAVSGRTFEVRNPASGEVIDTVPQAGPEDVHRAIEVAMRGKSAMAALPAHRRSDILRRAGELILTRSEDLTRLLTRENGKPIRQCRFEVGVTARLFMDFAEEAKRIRGHYLPMDNVPGLEQMVAYTVRHPGRSGCRQFRDRETARAVSLDRAAPGRNPAGSRLAAGRYADAHRLPAAHG
jgi:glyceraldehyde-3-phosphate dehydrogenase (NADP+)